MFTALQQDESEEDSEGNEGNDGDKAMADSALVNSAQKVLSKQSTNTTSAPVGGDPALADEDDEIT